MSLVPYVVRQGDYLAKLAARMGFDAEKVWNDPKNKALHDTRDPDILSPGDVLFVPDTPPPGAPLQLQAQNAFVAEIPTVAVTLALREEGEALANEPYVVEGLGEPLTGNTGADGSVTLHVPVDVKGVRIVLPGRKLAYPVLIGHLDPVETASGVRGRLANLGFYDVDRPADMPVDDGYDAARLRAATLTFQLANGLELTGAVDAETRAKLVAAHGR